MSIKGSGPIIKLFFSNSDLAATGLTGSPCGSCACTLGECFPGQVWMGRKQLLREDWSMYCNLKWKTEHFLETRLLVWLYHSVPPAPQRHDEPACRGNTASDHNQSWGMLFTCGITKKIQNSWCNLGENGVEACTMEITKDSVPPYFLYMFKSVSSTWLHHTACSMHTASPPNAAFPRDPCISLLMACFVLQRETPSYFLLILKSSQTTSPASPAWKCPSPWHLSLSS